MEELGGRKKKKETNQDVEDGRNDVRLIEANK